MIDFPEFFEKVPLAILVASEGKIVAGNPAFFNVFEGFSKEDLINRPIGDLIRPLLVTSTLESGKGKKQSRPDLENREHFAALFKGDRNVGAVRVSQLSSDRKARNAAAEEYFILTPLNQSTGVLPMPGAGETPEAHFSSQYALFKEGSLGTASSEQVLFENQAKLKLAMRLGKLALWEYDIDQGIVNLSQEFGRFVGETWQENRKISLDDYIQTYIYPPDKKKIQGQLERAVTSSYKVSENMNEYRLRRKDGSIINLLNIMRIKFDEEHIPISCEGIAQDITLLREAEAHVHEYHRNLKKLIDQRTKELKQSEERLSDALKLGRLTTWEFNFDTKKFSGGGEINNILGSVNTKGPKNEIAVDQFQKLIHPDDLPLYFSSFEKALKAESENYLDYIEYRIIKPDGEIRFLYLSIKVEIGEDGRHVRHYGTIQDITAIRRAEEDKERLKATIEVTPDIVAIVAPEGSLIYLNQAGRFFYGLLMNEDITKINFFDIQKEETKDLLKNTGFFTASTEGIWTGETELRGRNNQMEPVSMAIVAHFGQDGIVNSYSTIIRNISEQKKTEQDLKAKNAELDTFVYRASHDLRGPISSLLGLYQIVQFEVKDEKALSFFDMFNKQILRLNEIILALINLTKIKESITNQTPINFNEIVDEVIESLLHLVDQVNVKFEVTVKVEKEFKSDKSLIITIIQNLIENAIKYSRPNASPFAKVNIETIADNMLMIKVEDNGIGMSKEVQGKVFDMFYRGHEISKGSGLGLYILKNAVERLKGKILLESEVCVGTTFTIQLPYLE